CHTCRARGAARCRTEMNRRLNSRAVAGRTHIDCGPGCGNQQNQDKYEQGTFLHAILLRMFICLRLAGSEPCAKLSLCASGNAGSAAKRSSWRRDSQTLLQPNYGEISKRNWTGNSTPG